MSLKNVLKVKDPKLSRVLIVQNNVYAADRKIGQFFAGFFHISKRRKTALQLNRTETLKPGKKILTSSYLRKACVNKDFVHRGSIALIEGKLTHYVINFSFSINDSFNIK